MRFFCVLIIAGVFACTPSNDRMLTTKSGVRIDYLKKGDEKLIENRIMVVNTRYESDQGQVLLESKPENPVLMRYEGPEQDKGMLQEVLALLKVGDSVTFSIPAKNLYEVTWDKQVPDSLLGVQDITFYMGISDQLTTTEYFDFKQKQLEAPYREYFDQEYESLLTYLKKNKVETEKLENTLHYVIREDQPGELLQIGDTVAFTFQGRLLDGAQFGEGELTVTLGRGQIVPGLEEGLKLISEGDKATFYIPSRLAYGPQGAGKLIKPYSTLVFDIEVKEKK